MKHIVHIKDVPPNCYAAAILLERVYKQMEQRAWHKARDTFLDSELEMRGTLQCHYCHRNNLHRRGGKQHERATVDHILAKSEGGKEFCHTNFVVSCDGCNRKKASISQQEFLVSKYLTLKKRSKS